MNKKMLKFLSLGVMFFSGVAFAGPWSGGTEVTTVYPNSDGFIFYTS